MLEAPPTGRPRRPWRLRPLDAARTALRAVPQAIDGFIADRCSQHAAGIAYRVLFSLAPLAIVLVAIMGVVLQDDSLRLRVIHDVVGALPLSGEGEEDVTRAIEKLATPVNVLGIVSLFIFGWAASGMMGAIRTGLEVAIRVEQGRPAVRAKLVDLLLVVGAAALVLATVLLNIVVQSVSDWVERPMSAIGIDSGTLQAMVRHGVPLLVSTLVVLLLYSFVPARHLSLGDALAGALFTAVLLVAISLGSGWIYARTNHLSVIYGSLTVALVFLYSVYLYAAALLMGAEVAAAWSHPGPPSDERFGHKVRRLLLGLFVHQEAPPPRPAIRPPGD